MPSIVSPSTFRRRADYEPIDECDGASSCRVSPAWYDCRWFTIISFVFFCLLGLTVLLTILAIRSSYATAQRRQALLSTLGSSEYLTGSLGMPRITQGDIEEAYRDAIREIEVEENLNHGHRNVTGFHRHYKIKCDGSGDDCGNATDGCTWKCNENITEDCEYDCSKNRNDTCGWKCKTNKNHTYDCGWDCKKNETEYCDWGCARNQTEEECGFSCRTNKSDDCGWNCKKNNTNDIGWDSKRNHTKHCGWDCKKDTTERCEWNCRANNNNTGDCGWHCKTNHTNGWNHTFATDVDNACGLSDSELTEDEWMECNGNSLSAVRAYRYLNTDTSDQFLKENADAKLLERMTRKIAERHRLSPGLVGSILSGVRVEGHNCSILERPANCSSRYRSFDGTCNNLKHQQWGVAGTAYRRGLDPDYGDGISSPRQSSKEGHFLPSARAVSVQVHLAQPPKQDEKHTTLMTFWGQFVTHDIAKAAPTSGTVPCCGPLARNDSGCFPIDVTSDPLFSQLNVTCLPFIRSQAAAHPDCALGPRQQVNVITSYLDGSTIYGSSAEEAMELRDPDNGVLKTSTPNREAQLPVKDYGPSSFCSQASSNRMCFVAGDTRCNENLVLTSFHMIFLREHNRLVGELQDLNADWSAERLFQEARRIVVAELQHITFAEYLPKLLGSKSIDEHDLRLLNGHEYFDGYSEDVDATIANEFSTAAFRFGHSMVRGTVAMMNTSDIRLHRGLFTPWRFQENDDTLHSLLHGTARQSAFRVSPHYTTELVNHLFEGEFDKAGLDLAAIHVQRGRDHGIPSYNAFRKFCGLKPLRSARDLDLVFGKESARTFLSLYKNIDDIDLCSGGLAEPYMSGGMLGPTFACLIGDQFSRLRRGDRFWYENGPADTGASPFAFTPEQLAEIRKTSLARIICDNVPAMESIHPDVFSTLSSRNAPVSCLDSNRITQMNLTHWRKSEDTIS